MLPSWPLFAPYYSGLAREQDLRCALQPLPAGEFRGIRPRKAMEGHAFQLRWEGGHAPLKMATCQLLPTKTRAKRFRLSWSPISLFSG